MRTLALLPITGAAITAVWAVMGFARAPTPMPAAPAPRHVAAPANAPAADDLSPIPPQFPDPSLFASVIKRARDPIGENQVTGITVPHHLLAADLIAKGFRFASAARPSQVLLMSPDHFDLGTTDVSVAGRDFSTALGLVRADRKAAAALESLPFVRRQSFFYREHGIQAELPFVAHHFPGAEVIVIALKTRTAKTELDDLITALKGVLRLDALVIQSTDFSHYLPPGAAAIRDAETLRVLTSDDPGAILNLSQPDHLDTAAAQYVQTRLQREFFGSTLDILAHRNSQDYAPEAVDSTTSYIVQGYSRQK